MREQRIDVLSERVLSKADAICFTSNGVLTHSGCLVMGAGVAKAFRDGFPGLDASAGEAVRDNGNICQVVGFAPPRAKIIAFPTKHNWKDPSDLELIKKSARELMELIEKHNWKLVALPRPGCRNGGLSWDIVKAVIKPILDNRVVIVYF
jgi:O-acetyl-ADP-ribose deacetylase (regulator of RNase III)